MEASELIKSFFEKLGVEYELDDGGNCSFEADGLRVAINDLSALEQIALVGDLGEPPPERLDSLYKLMLEANYLLISTGGATLDLDSESGRFVLYQILPCRALDADSFYSVTERFVSTLEAWTKIVGNFRAALQEVKKVADEPPNGILQSGFMQV